MKMKHLGLLVMLCSALNNLLFSQADKECADRALFSSLANHEAADCEVKEFEQLTLWRTDKNKGRVQEDKQGEYLKIAYSYKGEFSTRPSALQIYTNYANAVKKNGGEILYNDANTGFYARLKKAEAVYWIKVNTDNSGWYYLETVKEAAMRQDVILTAAEIKTQLDTEGRLALYTIHFETGKSEVLPESGPAITSIAGYLKANKQARIYVVGHTDNTGDEPANMKLSADRAEAVVNQLVTIHTIDKSRLAAKGVGPLSPVAPNTTEEGRARNRRVEIVLR